MLNEEAKWLTQLAPEAVLMVEGSALRLSFRPLPLASVEELAMAQAFEQTEEDRAAIVGWWAEYDAAERGDFYSREPGTRADRPAAMEAA